jgi:DNA invertase Pin-like site-specific DNA recombinase
MMKDGPIIQADAGELAQALAYYRVSTSEQANTSFDDEGFSIRAQRDYCQRKAGELRATIVEEFIDRGKSARTADRPELQRLLRRVREDSEIRYLIVHKIDRLARSREDDVQLGLLFAKHGVKLVSATENIDETPSGKLVHGIMATIAEWYSGNLSEEAKKGMRKKVEAGGTPGKAPLGYVNQRMKIPGKDIGVVVVDPVAGPIVAHCFRCYASGMYTLGDLTDDANDLGLRMPATKSLPERPLQPQQMHRILRNRYYLGVVTYGGVEYPGDHEALIDEATFNTVDAILTARNLNKDKTKSRPHHLKGSLFCARCGRRLGITAPTKQRTGKTYPYFYCLGRQKDKNSCLQGYVSVADIEQAVADYWHTVKLPEERIQALKDVILADFEGRHAQGAAEVDRQRKRLARLEHERTKAKTAYYDDALTLDEFKLEQERINHETAAANAAIVQWTIEIDAMRRSLDEALSLLVDPYRLYTQAPEGINLMLVQAVCEKIWILDTSVVGVDLTTPFAELLTVEARAVLDGTATEGPEDREGVRMYHRRARGLSGLLRDLEDSWPRLAIERPFGSLPLENKNPASLRQGSDVLHLVGVAGFEPAASSSRTRGAAGHLSAVPANAGGGR